MNKFHIAITTKDLEATITDYSKRLGSEPTVVVPNEYALWRTESLNFSVRCDANCQPGEMRHLGWEDASSEEFNEEKDVNGIVWERFTAEQQQAEIDNIWPGNSDSK